MTAGEAVAITWPVAAGGYTPQTTANLSPAPRQAVTNRPVVAGDPCSVTLTNPMLNQCYCLQSP